VDDTLVLRGLQDAQSGATPLLSDDEVKTTLTQFQKTMQQKAMAMRAEQGLKKAQSQLGEMYFYGNGVTKDVAQAAMWYRKAAEQGDASAETTIGALYQRGEGVTKDAKEAVKWYGKAAAQGDASGQLGLSKCYVNGQGDQNNKNISSIMNCIFSFSILWQKLQGEHPFSILNGTTQ